MKCIITSIYQFANLQSLKNLNFHSPILISISTDFDKLVYNPIKTWEQAKGAGLTRECVPASVSKACRGGEPIQADCTNITHLNGEIISFH